MAIIEENIIKYLKPHYEKITYSDLCIQDKLSDNCGEFCISFIQNVKCKSSYQFISKFDLKYLSILEI